MDMLGKIPLALKALDAGITADELLVDVAQARGLFEMNDGMLLAADGRLDPGLFFLFIMSHLVLQNSVRSPECAHRCLLSR